MAQARTGLASDQMSVAAEAIAYLEEQSCERMGSLKLSTSIDHMLWSWGPQLDERMAIAQHDGLPTPLLDNTRSLEVAASSGMPSPGFTHEIAVDRLSF